ncbi:hypothetical protein JZ751_014975 [Albula glossodonta]|uniref:Uncharacterized protein n=1 Tax=Albula glossodonta TaxID=121402 RepID=A0A8T2MVI8_9TELE|nr:hypothetical protein JZ751_014975 [Albula glossodonta]
MATKSLHSFGTAIHVGERASQSQTNTLELRRITAAPSSGVLSESSRAGKEAPSKPRAGGVA